MDKEKKQIGDAHLASIMKAWLLVIPIIVGIIGSLTATALWLTARAEPAVEVSYQVNSLDKVLLGSIRGNFRRTYLQYLQARIDPSAGDEQVEQLGQRLDTLAQEEEKIMYKYDPEFASTWPSALETLLEILAQLPHPIIFTICLVIGILLFIITRSIAFFIISRRYSLDSGSDYVREA